MNNTIHRRRFIKQSSFALAAMGLPFSLSTFSKPNLMTNKTRFDVIIIGGSYAGLSAGMALGRSLKNVLIIDGGKPCNRFTPHSHNFITHDGASPADIAQKAKSQVLKYETITFLEDMAIAGSKTENGFKIICQSNAIFEAEKIIFASGVRDIFPDIKGFEACWGKTAIHCPYCHGYEFKGKQTAIIANGERAMHLVPMVQNLTNALTLITSGKADLSEAQKEKLEKNNIQLLEKTVTEFVHQNGNISSLKLDDGTAANFEAVYAQIPFEQYSNIPKSLGCELTEMGHIKIDSFQKTTVPGIYACGDNSSMMRSVAYAVATGNIAGAMVNNELTMERF